MFLSGLFLGTAARLLDIYMQNLGEIFSQMSIWILIGTLIAIYSPTKRSAMCNIFPFCIGMLLTYYATAMFTHGYLWWVLEQEHGYAAMGDGGNIIYINSDRNMVVAIASCFRLTAKDRIEFIRQYVEPAFCEERAK